MLRKRIPSDVEKQLVLLPRVWTSIIRVGNSRVWPLTAVMTEKVLRSRVSVTTALPKLKAALDELKKPNCGAIILSGNNKLKC